MNLPSRDLDITTELLIAYVWLSDLELEKSFCVSDETNEKMEVTLVRRPPLRVWLDP